MGEQSTCCLKNPEPIRDYVDGALNFRSFAGYPSTLKVLGMREDSLVVTHPTTNSPACGLSTAERTGSPIFHTLWSYVLDSAVSSIISREDLNKVDEDSLVVTHPTTNSPACGLSTAERTGSPVFHTLWSYVLDTTISWIITFNVDIFVGSCANVETEAFPIDSRQKDLIIPHRRAGS
ncbi:hypothetical protein N7461_007481 [Penicillium sp. DV-2018c]|nr:hypothetical protein N7461_007481 [Penicillium sp. DV-2018c]